MTLYQKFIELTGLLHISEAEFNAAMDPKTDAQKALRGFIGWSIGKTDANSDAALFRKTIDYKYTEKVDNYTAVTNLSNFGDVPSTEPTAPTVKPTTEEHAAPSTDDHKNDAAPVADTVSDVVVPVTEPTVKPVADTDHNDSNTVGSVVADTHSETAVSASDDHVTSNVASATSGSEVTNGVTEHSTLEVH